MLIGAGSRVYLYIPVSGPTGWSPADTTIEIALVLDGAEPGAGDWHAAVWDGTEGRLLVGTTGVGGGATEYLDGDYIALARLTRGAEQVPVTSGRVRVGAGSAT